MVNLYEEDYYNNFYPQYNRIIPHIQRFGKEGALFYSKLISEKNEVICFNSKEIKHPIYLRNNTSDVPTFYQVFYRLDYELDYTDVPEVIVDCGANIGLSTVFFKNKFPNSKIIAVEPEESNYQLLLQNIDGYNDIYPLKKGIWNKKTNLTVENIGLGNWGFVVKEANFEDEKTIKAVSIDEIMRMYNLEYIDILKIDIEGSEKELFDLNSEKWLPYIKCIIVELHDRFKEGCSESFYKAIEKYEFNMSHSGENIIISRDIG